MKPSGATSLQGKRGLVVGIANDASIAAGCARAFVAEGADLAATYLNDKARPHVNAVTDAPRLQAAAAVRCAHPRSTGGRLRADPD